MGIQFSDRVENFMGKEEIARYQQFLLFPQCFQKLYVDEPKGYATIISSSKVSTRPKNSEPLILKP